MTGDTAGHTITPRYMDEIQRLLEGLTKTEEPGFDAILGENGPEYGLASLSIDPLRGNYPQFKVTLEDTFGEKKEYVYTPGSEEVSPGTFARASCLSVYTGDAMLLLKVSFCPHCWKVYAPWRPNTFKCQKCYEFMQGGGEDV